MTRVGAVESKITSECVATINWHCRLDATLRSLS